MKSKRITVLLTIALFTFMTSLDSSIVNIATPIMAREMNVSSSTIEWVISIYLMIISALIMFFGRLGDIVGKVKIFKIGTLIFTIGSLVAGIKINFSFLLFGRAIQALGAAMIMSNNFGITTEMFPLKERGRALSILATFFALGSIAGPSLGGLILTTGSWSYIFWINVPIGIVAILVSNTSLPKDSLKNTNEKLDWYGTTTFAAFIAFFFYALMQGQTQGYANPIILTTLAIAIVLLIAFIVIEYHVKLPMLNFKIFDNANFTMGVVSALLAFIVGYFFSILIPYYLVNARNYNAGFSGILLAIIPLTIAFFGPIGGTLADKFGGEKISIIGLASLIIAQILILNFNLHSPLWLFIVTSFFYGIGMGLFQSPNNSVIMSSVDKKFLGIAGSVNSLARNFGMELGVSLSTIILYSSMSLREGKSITTYPVGQNQLFMFGLHTAFIFALIFAVIAEIITITRFIKNCKNR
ncbi:MULTISPECIES: MFS transporter [Lactobacillaceae]|uniref:MFS transporter n=1 Tax=Pediococcus pentosaceus CGMCC 7049 TaxID=1460385 RepID=A0AAU7NNX9_PEDPE|nr:MULTISPECIES: MFS transporter [Lactobacillaceae]MCM8610224.1 MFS transporter [Lactiplantibacillus sp. B652]WAE46333.1 MFS transporter [Levilactobacillus brevis]